MLADIDAVLVRLAWSTIVVIEHCVCMMEAVIHIYIVKDLMLLTLSEWWTNIIDLPQLNGDSAIEGLLGFLTL